MLYPEYIQHRKPEISLPYPKCTKTFIYEFYEIFEVASDPRTEAKCKQCGESVFMMRGTVVSSSYTSGLVAHLQKHPGQWNLYLDRLKDTITPDNKTPRQHYQSRIRYKLTDKEVSSRNLEKCTRNYSLNRKNVLESFTLSKILKYSRIKLVMNIRMQIFCNICIPIQIKMFTYLN